MVYHRMHLLGISCYSTKLVFDIFLTAIGLTPGGGSPVHFYTQTILRTTQ
jgi:hypothetical protein